MVRAKEEEVYHYTLVYNIVHKKKKKEKANTKNAHIHPEAIESSRRRRKKNKTNKTNSAERRDEV